MQSTLIVPRDGTLQPENMCDPHQQSAQMEPFMLDLMTIKSMQSIQMVLRNGVS